MDEGADYAFSTIENTNVINTDNDDRVSAYSWVADSGTTSHIVNDHNAFIKYTLLQNKHIIGVGNIGIDIFGCGTIEIIMPVNNIENTVTLENVLYAPSAVNNLFSLSRLDEKGG
jgi:hypothetical protein